MVMNCLSEVFSFTCRRKKKRSNIFKKNKDESESDTLSNCTVVSKHEKQEDNFDIIDSYSKTNDSKIKIKKSIQVNKAQLEKKPKVEPESPELITTLSEDSENIKTTNKQNRSKINKKNISRNERTAKKKTCQSDNNSSIEELTDSLKKLNLSKKKHKLVKLTDRVRDMKNGKKNEVEHRKTKSKKYVSEESSPSQSPSISSVSEQRNFLSDADIQRNIRKSGKLVDSDSEIWFLKNKNENMKFNHNLRMKMVEYLIKKSSK